MGRKDKRNRWISDDSLFGRERLLAIVPYLDNQAVAATAEHHYSWARMWTEEQAPVRVVAELSRPLKYRFAEDPKDLSVMDEWTIERESGWVFFHTAERRLKTRL
jgi:hypothetical protein